MKIGDLIGSGRSANVYALDDDAWVLRRYTDGQTATREAAVMAHLHAHGYPVPAIRPVDPAAPGDLVLQRLTGPTMVEAALTGAIDAAGAAATLAGLLVRLHAVPPTPDAAPGARILHLDFHPLNVMLTADGPMVIDWGNTEPGPPALDWALSALILAQVAVAEDALAPLAGELLDRLLERTPADIDLDAGILAQARGLRAADPMQTTAELGLLDAAVARVMELVRG